MTRVTWVLAATSTVLAAVAIWFYVDNRSLRDQLATRPHDKTQATTSEKVAAARSGFDVWSAAPRGKQHTATGPAPSLPEQKEESRLERRQRRQQEFAAMFGRQDGETEDEYRNRIVPLIKGGLLIPRQRLDGMRKEVEQKASVTAEQSKQLDKAFDKVYADTIDYTNKAIADGTLSPYQRNVSGWLEFAGGLGGILGDANTQIGQILTPQQVQTINSSGFEWGEYLGVNAPWEQLKPPPLPAH